MTNDRPNLWVVDSPRAPLAACLDAFSEWAEYQYFGPDAPLPNEFDNTLDAIFFSAEIQGGADGDLFATLITSGAPLLAVSSVRSLAQAVAYFRAGVGDYLSLPLDAEDARERCLAAMDKAREQAMPSVMVELEAVDDDAGDISLTISPSNNDATTPAAPSEDILADLPNQPEDEEEPVAVDGLPIPTLWEELPCGLLVFDSNGNLVFCNQLGLDLFNRPSLADLQEALETDLARFSAYAANHNPLPDNQWPHVLARKTRTARSAVISIETSEKRRAWLRVDCLPHISDGALTRLTMSVINLTGELPPLSLAEQPAAPKKEKAKKRAKRGK